MGRYWTEDREAGNLIEGFDTYAEAKAAIAEYENQDKADGTYEPNFYSVHEMDLSDFRRWRGGSQQGLAEATGINIRQIQKIESGEIKIQNITLRNAARLAEALGIEIKDLISYDDIW